MGGEVSRVARLLARDLTWTETVLGATIGMWEIGTLKSRSLLDLLGSSSFSTCSLPLMGSHSGAPAGGEHRVPVEQVLNGLEVHPLEQGETAMEAFILVKVLDRDGDVSWSYRTTNRLSREELLGALTVQVDVLRKSLRDEWDDD